MSYVRTYVRTTSFMRRSHNMCVTLRYVGTGVAIFACAGVALGTRLMLQVCPTTLTALAAAAHHAPGMITTEKASSGSHSHAQYGAVSAPGRGGGSISVNSMQQVGLTRPDQ